jgi:Zinc carboxypeptidase
VKSQSFMHLGRWLAVMALLLTVCAASVASPATSPGAGGAPVSTDPASTLPPIIPIGASTTVAPSTASTPTIPDADTTLGEPTTSTEAPVVADVGVLAGISMTEVPRDVIVPTSAESLDSVSNPINGRRGRPRPLPDDFDCVTETDQTCLTGMLDTLGFDVTSGSEEDRERQVRRATAVIQLDAGLPVTGVADDDVLRYLGIATDSTNAAVADEERQIGTSARGRRITALRYGNGPKTVLVVGQTHGDEEAGLRVLLRLRSLLLPEELTLWVVPTMNPDGLALDTRFLTNGADPNRQASTQIEQQAVYDFALATRPSLTVWYHQNYGWVGASGASVIPAQHYQERTGLGTLKHSGNCAKGFMWCPIDDALGSSSILVELPDVVTSSEVQIHASALLNVASDDA